MAYDNDQQEFPVPTGSGKEERKSSEFLPKYFRTPVNNKFLHSTLDQLISQGQLEKINAYYGRKNTPNYQASDLYVEEVSKDRENYKLEPSIVQKDELGNVNFYTDYIDYFNQIRNLGGYADDHSNLNAQEYYAWSPKINWDKFVNYREYFWLPYGADTVTVTGQQRSVVSTYTVSKSDAGDNYAYVFTPDGLTSNPTLKLYKGQTYKFEIDTQGMPFTIKTERNLDDSYNYNTGVSGQKIEKGTITFVVDDTTPETLYYGSSKDIESFGLINIYSIAENSAVDVDSEVVGKKSYTLPDGTALSNGMKVNFRGTVTPTTYAEGEYYVEGVGEAIKLINVQDLEVVSSYTQQTQIPFDTVNFDTVGFGTATSYAVSKDYVVINKASSDRNPWSRHNRWIHKSVIEASAKANGNIPNIDQTLRARRPIIEFEAGLKLYQFGTSSKGIIDLIDDKTTDVMSNVEGATGYFVDGVNLTDGMKVLFTKDIDPLVKNKIYTVKILAFTKNKVTTNQISLVETTTSPALTDETVLVRNGTKNAGKIYYYNGTDWKLTQEKTKVNQAPLFELYDNSGNSYASTTYPNSNFIGNKIFSYKEGTGTSDTELGFPLTYLNVENIGDIVFDYNLPNDTFQYVSNQVQTTKKTNSAFLRKYTDRTTFNSVNGWTKAPTESYQPVVRQYTATAILTNDFEIDVYNLSGDLNDLTAKVYVNDLQKIENTDWSIHRVNQRAYIRFATKLNANDVVVIKTRSATVKNANGYYEFPTNLQGNPLNEEVSTFTTGQINDHVKSITSELPEWQGRTPGVSNLRDFPNASDYGRKFLKHSGPIGLASYLLNRKDVNVMKAIEYSQKEYTKFKRAFVSAIDTLGYEGSVQTTVDKLLEKLNKDNTKSSPFFQTDMIGRGAFKKTAHTVLDIDSKFYQLTNTFDLTALSKEAVYVYHNDAQLIHGKDYIFNNGFVNVTKTLTLNDRIDVYEYDTTNGSHIPATPTKLGLYPAYRPMKYSDTTLVTPVNVIQGHDGSITVAYNDFRDDLILELEKRIFNNIKVTYNEDILNYKDLTVGSFRTNLFNKTSIDNSVLPDFNAWLGLVGNADYTNNSYYLIGDSRTWNYSHAVSPAGKQLAGFWRAIYKELYDTDRPNITPWEMLGYTVEPTWWESTYGPAPYTKDNLVLWKDLEQGIVREPNKKIVYKENYARPGLTGHIPADTDGNIRSPFDSAYARQVDPTLGKLDFKFGDESPVETAWRRSSDFPFALLKAFILHQPSKVIGLGWDTSRISRNSASQIVYNGEVPIQPKNLLFPSAISEETVINTSGLVNYLFDYIETNLLTDYADYKTNSKSIQAQLGFKLRGYSKKEKFQLILDSKTPNTSTSVFVPQENYRLIQNTSSAIKVLNYSAVIVELAASGYIIRGYDRNKPQIRYYDFLRQVNDPVIQVGGVSSSFVNWGENQRYNVGQYVKYNDQFYATETAHLSTETFDLSKFVKLVELPTEGGAEAILRRRFDKSEVKEIAYGTIFKTKQEVVDILIGYGEYLKDEGFSFEEFSKEIGQVANWQLSAKEFLFWTTQKWDEGSVISLSPASRKLSVQSSYSVADDVVNNFYSYGILKEDGNKLDKNFVRIVRQSNNFSIVTKNTINGIYFAKVPLVQKEQVCLIDNNTSFSDLIYDPASGYKQDRLKVLGYLTEWDGSQSIPGFVFSVANTKDWTAFTDYAMSDVVKYKQYYYTATKKLKGSASFVDADWSRLDGAPSDTLISNFDYRANQFGDFYDLDTDNFDSEQQRMAQHLIGYQPRTYLKNIINDDVAQYKFYQGFVREKGTTNALTKMFDALSSADKESIDFYEEWAIRKGQYGASAVFDEIEYNLDESKIRLNPQPIELTDNLPTTESDLTYRIQSGQVYLKPDEYTHSPFPTKYSKNTYVKTAGPVNPVDISLTVGKYADLLTADITNIVDNNYVWVGDYNSTWNVFRYSKTTQRIQAINVVNNTIEVDTLNTPEMTVGEIFVVYANGTNYTFKCTSVEPSKIVCEPKTGFQQLSTATGYISRFISAKFTSTDAINNRVNTSGIRDNEKFWIEASDDGKWKVVNNKFVYKTQNEISTTSVSGDESFGQVIATNKNNTVVLVSQPTDSDGAIYVFVRGTESGNLRFSQKIEAPTQDPLLTSLDLFGSSSSFGSAVDISPDGNFVVIGAPTAGNLKTEYKGVFSPSTNYNVNNIVQYKNQLWRATNQITGQDPSVDFTTFDGAGLYKESTQTSTSNIVIGDHIFSNVTTTHLLIRASRDQYQGTKIGDRLIMQYLGFSSDYPLDRSNLTKATQKPFAGVGDPTIKTNLFSATEVPIVQKVDAILKVDLTLVDPILTAVVNSTSFEGTVVYKRKEGTKTLLYLKDVEGVVTASGTLMYGALEVGTYNRVLVEDYSYLSGFWMVDINATVSTSAGIDTSNHLVIQDIKRQGVTRNTNKFVNSIDETIQAITPQTPMYQSQFGVLTYYESYYIDSSTNQWVSRGSPTGILNNNWYVRTTPTFTKSQNDTINVWFNTVGTNKFDFAGINITSTDTNGLKTVADVMDGYIDVDSQSDSNNNFYFPGVGDTVRDDVTLNTATVVLTQFTALNKLRVWIKNSTGTFTLGSNAGVNGTITRIGTPNRALGNIEQTNMAGLNGAGKLLVFTHTGAITISGNATEYFANDKEYWLWDEQTLDGISASANTPSSTNYDWNKIFNIPIGEGTASGLTNEGAFLIYKKDGTGTYSYNSAYTVPDTKANLKLGSRIKVRTVGDKTVAFIGASGNLETNNPGKIYFVEYNANKNWTLGTDPLYTGTYDNTANYVTGELVVYANQLYKANTNLTPGAWNPVYWTLQSTRTDMLGYIPNDSGIELEQDSTLAQNGLVRFADRFDVDDNGVNIIANILYNNDNQKVVVYRLDNGHYTYKQTIVPPNDSAAMINFGSDISISGDGTLIAVGSPLKDLTNIDMGAVYVYKKAIDDTGVYSYNQTLSSPDREVSENFGHTLAFSGTVLAVTSLKGDMQVPTTLDAGTTSFDDQMTTFTKTYTDSGAVHIYQKFEDTMLYGEKFNYANDSLQQFGSNLTINNNHVYIGLPTLQLTNQQKGTVINFRKAPTENNWTSIHEMSTGIDQIDLTKIKSIFLYDKVSNKKLIDLDYIDPLYGKIPGQAEAEIFYKTMYDPAVYNNSTATGTIDATNSWTDMQVGRLWWNLDTAVYYYPYQSNIIFNNSYWNKLFPGASIDVHEWTESLRTPTEWNTISATTQGASLGVTGTVSDTSNFVTRKKYDAVAGSMKNIYYYWVKGKKTVPEMEGRSMTAEAVQNLIKDPRAQGYKYVTMFGPNKFALVNCDSFINGKDTVINFRLFNTESNNNVHNEYALVSENLGTSTPPKDIENVWFNSLIGYDEQMRPVPNPELSDKVKYGTLTNPRQSWFKNNAEATKQLVQRANDVLIKNLIVDEVDLSTLTSSEPQPVLQSGLFDETADTEADLQFLGTGPSITATLVPTIVNGKITNVTITNAGYGYKVAPTYKIKSTHGTDAVLTLTINAKGQITSVKVEKQGKNYDSKTQIVVRNLSALVRADSSVDGKWAIYNWTSTDGWTRTQIQSYNVSLYWNYADWYATGYTQFTAIDQKVDYSYQLDALQNSVGDIVKISTIGTGGWLLLEKIDSQVGVDYTVNYKTVGRQNGTIQFNTKLYDYANQNIGFDSNSYDVQLYDRQPIEETRLILQTLRDKIFVEELDIEYNRLFFASVRYALSEAKVNDWVFKTSFVKAQHNVGELQQKRSFRNDNLSNFEDYIAEVKPYKTKVREYVSSYQKTEPTNTSIADFDYPPRYLDGYIQASNIRVSGTALTTNSITSYPDKHWLDNVGYKVTEINVANAGSDYIDAPKVTITGGGGSGATATAFIKNGKVTRIRVDTEGSGYISTPTIAVSGNATASAVLGKGVTRATHVGVKFDRTTGTLLLANLSRTETFTGNASQLKFKLKWPMDLRSNTITVSVGGVGKLRSEFTFANEDDTTKSYARKTGYVQFTTPPANLSTISITYLIDQDVLHTQDRVNLYYSPTDGQPGKELAQVIDGIDYGGVEVRSITFEDVSGWDNAGYGSGEWDTYDTTYEDEIFYLDGSTQSINLSTALESGVQYHVYRRFRALTNGRWDWKLVRMDDPNFGTGNPVTNTNAVMKSLEGDGSTKTVDVSAIETGSDDIIIVRKSTSDGSFLPDPDAVDSLVKGGDLAYSTATGLNAEDINMDGDGFVTPTSSHGPEEFVPGQVLDTLDIQVYDRGAFTGSKINSYNYIGDGATTTYSFVDFPQSNNAVFVSVDNILFNNNLYSVDYQNKNLVFNSAPTNGAKINFITMGNSGESILDVDIFTGDGSTTEFVTRGKFKANSISTLVKVNGVDQTHTVFETDSTYSRPGKVAVRFTTAPTQDAVINICVYESASQSFSEVTQNSFNADGSTTAFTLSPTPFTQQPFTNNVIVKVDNDVLRSGFTKQHILTATGGNLIREYQFKTWQVLPGTILATNVRAFLNKAELTAAQYRWNPGNSSVTLESGVGAIGDVLEIYIENGEYSVSNTGVLTISPAPANGKTITAYQFSKHDIQDIEREQFDVIARQSITVNTEDYFTYNQLTNGVIQLRRPATDAQYVWVCVNGEWLAPSVDYTVSNDQNRLLINRNLSQNDEIDVIHFSAPSFIGKFAYRQFKDMLNRSHFKRVGDDKQYYLAQDLNWSDREIVLTDGTGLTDPSIGARLPGILFIDGERIEYYQKQGHTIKQLRRGTFGTGIPTKHTASTQVFDQSRHQNVPYKDEFLTENYTGANVSNNQLTISFTPKSANEFEIFVGGKRLRKNSISVYDPANGQDSPEADTTVQAEFTVDGVNPVITFTTTPSATAKIAVIRKQGKIWHDTAKALSQTDNDIARFIRQKEVALPQ